MLAKLFSEFDIQVIRYNEKKGGEEGEKQGKKITVSQRQR